MKTCLRVLPFALCLAISPVRAADATPAPTPASSDTIKLPKFEVTDAGLPKKTDPYINPLTGTPYVAVHNADIVECVIFINEFQRAHPQEHAVLLTKEITRYNEGRLQSAIAFSWNGKVYLHCFALGDVLIPNLLPGQIDDSRSQLHALFLKLQRYYLQKSFEKLHVHFPLSTEQATTMSQADTLPHVLPGELPGDTDDIQTNRVVARLKKLGLRYVNASFNVSGTDPLGNTLTANQVTFAYGAFTYGWTRYGNCYRGFSPKTYLPSMIDSVIFSIDYQKANPSEKVFCFLHEASNLNQHPVDDIVSTTVYTKKRKLWFHHCEPGDLPSSLSLGDLKDSEKVIRADLAVYEPAIKKFNTEDSHRRHQSPTFLGDYLKGYKTPDLSITGVQAELQNRGVETKVISNADQPELRFVWGGQPYIYAPEKGCFADKPKQLTASN